MKKLFLLFTYLLSLFTFLYPIPNTLYPASAHLLGQPPFFKVNGKLSDFYHVSTTSLTDFNLPQDAGPDNYLVNQPINFEIDASLLPVPSDIVSKTDFIWDFGDGSSGQGLKNNHTYTKAGSYILKITAKYREDTTTPQLLQSILLNVLPNSSYQLPKSVIEINGWQSKDPLIDILEANFDSQFSFDGSKSDPGSSKIIEYFWDFGDQNSSGNSKVKHQYSINPYTVFPVLRVTTADGFIADSFVQIKEKNGLQNNPAAAVKDKITGNNPRNPNGLNTFGKIAVTVVTLAVLYAIGFGISKLRKKRS